MGHFSASETYADLYTVAVVQELLAAAQLDVEIVLARDGADVRVRLPRIGAWACGYLSFR